MSAGVARAAVRVTVVGADGRADLVVPLGTDVATLSRAYAEAVGAATPPRLRTVAGAPVPEHLHAGDAVLGDGALVVAEDAGVRDAAEQRRGQPAPTAARLSRGRLVATGLAAACGLAGAAVLALADVDGPVRAVGLALLLLCAVLTALPVDGGRDPAATARARAAASPAFGAAAGFAATYRDAPGGLLLALAVAAMAAAVFAALSRMFLDAEHDELTLVWLVVCGCLGAVVTVLLLTGAAAHGVWTLVFAAAVVAARLLPYTVVDVPDRALLDLDRLAVTAWSARDRPRAGRRRAVVRYDGVEQVARRGQDLVSTGTLLIVLLAAAAGPLLLEAGTRDLGGIASVASVGLGAVALALVARSFRAVLPRTALRVCAAWLFASTGLAVVRAGDTTTDWSVFAGAAVLAAAVVLTAVQLGRGWRSVWWARAADIAEGLGVVLIVALVPLASGFSDVVRGFVS